jgi:hypothetical protein
VGAGGEPGLSGGSFKKPPDVMEDAEPSEDMFIEDSFYPPQFSLSETSAEFAPT